MRIAVCFSGQWRTGNYCYENLKQFLGILYPYCDFFIHTWDISKQKCYNLSNVFSKETKLSDNEIEKINKNYKPKKIIIQDYKSTYDALVKHEEHSEFKIFNIIQPLWYSFMKSIELKKEYELKNSFEYDYVLKLRPDVIFNPHRRLSQDIELYKDEIANGEFYIENLMREWTIDNTVVDDVYFLSNSKVMNAAAKYYSEWVEWGILNGVKPFYGFIRHSILNNFKLCKFKVRDLGGEPGYAIYRPECIKHPNINVVGYYKCRECEDYYYGSPQNHQSEYYINFLKNKYYIVDNVQCYVDELEPIDDRIKII